ncbi:MAG: hypothetical protein QM652_11005 [Legionella sp.]|uniref:hypothetical protein n=1 Tax=Legionella sp. TaxID=459 RepID=UPI0039E2D1B1
MNQRLLWNFEFAAKTTTFPREFLTPYPSEDLKWEVRYFWPNDQPIVLNLLDNALLDITNYKQKHHEDYYFLLPNKNYNIKRRRDELLYKPLRQKSTIAFGFAAKINLEYDDTHSKKTRSNDPLLQEITQQVIHEGIEVYVQKKAFTYKFPTTPKVKLELAHLEVHKQIYFSACIEGRSQKLVENLAEYLLGQQISCEYVSFLKHILHL